MAPTFPLLLPAAFVLLSAAGAAQASFVNWENAHVHPLELSPDGTRLFAVNTPDNRLEVFDPTGAALVPLFDVPVGLDPVSVRARTSDEVWVVNHVSDSISVVSVSTRRVVQTLRTDDEPADVIFAGTPERAFVSCSQANTVLVFDPANLAAAPVRVAIAGEDPRALAKSADGSKVYVAIFDSGNGTTILGGGATGTIGFPPNVVDDPNTPYGGQNPPPNAGAAFVPPLAPGNPPPPKVGLIVRKNAGGQWLDDNGGDWTAFVSGANSSQSGRPVGWDVIDNDVAILDTASLSVGYATRLMNLCMAIAVNPGNGQVTVVGTEATNEIRFEPVLKGKFTRVELARVAAGGATLGVGDLNPHLSYATSTVPQSERDKSIGDPRGIAWNASGTKGYVTGMGSNNLVVVDAAGNRAGAAPTIAVGEGPTGVVVDDARARVYVLNKFEAAISVVDVPGEVETARVPFYDPSPAAIRVGRKHLYDTRKNSGLGQIACASCHVDARIDHLAWDLGDPSGAMKATTGQNLGANLPGLNQGFQPWHPMKGPMATQTMQDIIGKEPLHWRGDRAGLEEFNGAFTGLQGDDASLTQQEMQEFEDFLATIAFPPNPFRNLDNSLPTSLPLPGHFTTGRFGPAGQPLPNGNAVQGLSDYRALLLDGGAIRCVTCHTLPTGIGTDYALSGGQLQPIPPGPDGERHHMLVSVDGSTNVTIKVAQLRNLYEKVGFEMTQTLSRKGFGFLHDGSVDSTARFLNEPVFNFTSDQQTANMVAFMMAFSGSDLPQGSPSTPTEPPGTASRDSRAAVGVQTTLVDAANPAPGQAALITTLTGFASTNKVGLVVKGQQGGLARGWTYVANSFRSDRASDPLLSPAALQALATPGSELTYTAVPKGSETRIGIDRDLDGWFDRDELDAGTDPADPLDFPSSPGVPFCAGDGLDPLVTTLCPCFNFGGPGRGCANSVEAQGAVLSASGAVNPDTVVLSAAGMPATATAIYLQGDATAAAGVAFGDGLRCAAGNLRRLAVVGSVNGASQYPGPGDPSISARSAALGDAFGPGATRYYQTYYRDPDLAFCGAPTGNSWNVTNGQVVAW